MAEIFDRFTSSASSNAAAFRPEKFGGEDALVEADATQAESLTAAFGMSNDFAITERALDTFAEDRGEFDPDFTPGTFLQNNEEFNFLLAAAEEDSDLFDALHDSFNEQDLLNIAGRYKERLEAFEDATDNGIIAALGFIGGIALSPTSYLPLGIIKGGQVLGIAARTAKSARMVAASRLALLEGGFQGGIAAVEGVSDPSIGAGEIFLQGAAGATIAGPRPSPYYW